MNKRLYIIWRDMKRRCLEKNHASYKNYGGRGIKICEEWYDFIAFRKWALSNGYQDNLEIDRINNDGDYTSENCRWVTDYDQIRNRRVTRWFTIDGVTLCLKDWCIIYNQKVKCVSYRIKKGMTIEDALKKPVKYFTFNGIERSLREWCKIYKIKYKTVQNRMGNGINFKDALTMPLQRGKKL
jgi:hypothetical protein